MSEERSLLDLVELLIVSGGLPPETALRVSREIDLAFGFSATRGRGSTEAQRARWRKKAARKRARQRGDVPGGRDTGGIILRGTKTLSSEEKKKTGPRPPGDVPRVCDGWPDDHVEQFWKAFPPFRREAKAKVAIKLAKLRADKVVGWEELIEAVRKFAATNPGQYAPAPMAWLNGGKWDREYGPTQTGGTNGKAQATSGGFSVVAARLRQSIAAESDLWQQDAGADEPLHRR